MIATTLQRLTTRATALWLVALLVGAAAGVTTAAASPRATRLHATLTVYAVPATVQFLDHADDRLRGMATNPFKYTQALVIIANGKEKGSGPFAGDDVLYTFHLYASPARRKSLGTAIFTCYFNFTKHATCDTYFDLKNGLVLASGAVVFDSTRFILSITGGTQKYLGALGQVTSFPAANNAQRFDLQVTGASG